MIYTVRTTVGRENAVMETLNSKRKIIEGDIRVILHPAELKGYIFVEGGLEAVENMIKGTPHIRGLIRKQVSIKELSKFLETKKIEIKINRGDIVEVTGGPFKNERGKVIRVDEAKEELTIELLEAAIPIPITISTDSVRVIEQASE